MPGFGTSGRHNFGGEGGKERIVGKVEDIKAAPKTGEKRVIIREKDGSRSSMAVDMPTGCCTDLERKKTYSFEAEKKQSHHNGGGQMRNETQSYRAYHCDTKPHEYTGTEGRTDVFDRFGDNERGGGTDRSKRKFLI